MTTLSSLSIDDLDEHMFENEEAKNTGEATQGTAGGSESSSPSRQAVPRTPQSSARRRAWLWKTPLQNSFDEADMTSADRHQAGASSAENSRRASLCSSHSSPSRSSPRRARRKDSERQRSRKESKEAKESGSRPDSGEIKLNAAQRLYRVLEEQALGEAVGRLSAGSAKNRQAQTLNLCATTNDPSTSSNPYNH